MKVYRRVWFFPALWSAACLIAAAILRNPMMWISFAVLPLLWIGVALLVLLAQVVPALVVGIPIAQAQFWRVGIEAKPLRLRFAKSDGFGVKYAAVPSGWRQALAILAVPATLIATAAICLARPRDSGFFVLVFGATAAFFAALELLPFAHGATQTACAPFSHYGTPRARSRVRS